MLMQDVQASEILLASITNKNLEEKEKLIQEIQHIDLKKIRAVDIIISEYMSFIVALDKIINDASAEMMTKNKLFSYSGISFLDRGQSIQIYNDYFRKLAKAAEDPEYAKQITAQNHEPPLYTGLNLYWYNPIGKLIFNIMVVNYFDQLAEWHDSKNKLQSWIQAVKQYLP